MPRSFSAGFLLSLLVMLPASAQAPAADSAELVERERIRSTIEGAYALLVSHLDDATASTDDFDEAATRVIALGEGAVPFLIAELDALAPHRFFFAVYVLARLGAFEAEEPLRRALALADEEGDEYARRRKAWCALALAMLGQADAVDLLDTGKTKAARTELARELTAIEATAMVLGRRSVPRLLAQLERYAEDEEMKPRRAFTLRALTRLADPSVGPKVLHLVDDENLAVRSDAVRLLGVSGHDPKVVSRLIEALADPSVRLRKVAVQALDDLRPSGAVKTAMARLELEDDGFVRGVLYRLIAEEMGTEALELFGRYWGRQSQLDRAKLAEALGRVGPRALNLLRAALRDPHPNVRIRAVDSIAAIGGKAGRDTLLATLRDANWPVRFSAIDALWELGDYRVAPRVADLLLREALPNHRLEASSRSRVRRLGEMLVNTGYTAPIEDLRRARRSMADPETASYLDELIRRLGLLAERDNDTTRWIAAVASEDPVLRELAFTRLAALGSDAAIDALVAAFEQLSDDERLLILRQVARTGPPQAAGLIERVLKDPEFDREVRFELRSAAAWAARRIGGERMVAALRASVLRRHGRDYPTLVYLAVLAGPEALDALEHVRVPRVTYPRTVRGVEQLGVEEVIRQLRQGRALWEFDVPPLRLPFRG